jgi:hypothetical protein
MLFDKVPVMLLVEFYTVVWLFLLLGKRPSHACVLLARQILGDEKRKPTFGSCKYSDTYSTGQKY